MSLIDLPQSKWGGGIGRQPILTGDFAKIEAAIIQSFGLRATPRPQWVDVTEIKVPATADSPAQIMMTGFPNILHPGLFVSGGLTDGRYRENTAAVTMDFDLSTALWGSEKVSQYYLIYALAGNAATVFTLKSMPMMRVKSQASQVISLGTLSTPASGIGYGFTTNELVDGMIYVLTGASRGLVRAITANNNDNSTGGTITYSGTALTLAAGDWFVVLPPATNFRLIGDVFNNSSGNLEQFFRLGNAVQRVGPITCTPYPGGGAGLMEDIRIASPLAVKCNALITGGSEIGHPDLGASTDSKSGQSVSGSNANGASVDFYLDFCRYYTRAASIYANSFSYPEGYFG